MVAAESNRVPRYSLSGAHGASPSSRSSSGKGAGSPATRKASWAAQPAAWCWPWPSRGVPLNTDTTTWGRKRRTMRTTSLSTESRGQWAQVSSRFLE